MWITHGLTTSYVEWSPNRNVSSQHSGVSLPYWKSCSLPCHLSPLHSSFDRELQLQRWRLLTRHEKSCPPFCLPLASELRLQRWTRRAQQDKSAVATLPALPLRYLCDSRTYHDLVSCAFCKSNSLCRTSRKCMSHASGCNLKEVLPTSVFFNSSSTRSPHVPVHDHH